jgi:hypothetical protein
VPYQISEAKDELKTADIARKCAGVYVPDLLQGQGEGKRDRKELGCGLIRAG